VTPAPRWATALHRLTRHCSEDLLGGPRPWTLATVINLQKGGTLAFLGVLLWHYGAPTNAAWTYLALHGGYGLVWLLKDVAFPDPRWRVRVTLAGGLAAFALVLGPYWAFGWMLLSHRVVPSYPVPEAPWLAFCTLLCLLGCTLMIAADAQKYYTLRVRPGLITDGVHRYIRHPNYLGEMLVYGSFALVVWHWIPFAILAWVWGAVFAPNMCLKEASLSRYDGWASYRARTWWLVPGLF
jgi:protein-S-isoprenylcysteine O-methyltransferase Ste14